MIKELNEQQVSLAKEIETIKQEWKGREASMPPLIEERLDKALNDFDANAAKIERHERTEKVSAWSSQAAEKFAIAPVKDAGISKVAKEVKNAFLINMLGCGDFETSKILSSASDQVGILKHAYQADNFAGGGSFVLPMEMNETIITLMKDLVFVRKLGTAFPCLNSDTLGFPAMDTDPSDDDWTTEIRTGGTESTAATGRRELKPNPMAKLLLLSKTLLRKAPNAEGVFLDRVAYKASITEEKAFLTGDGSQKPLGVFTASTAGIPTTRDTTAASTTTFTADELINTQMSLKAQYRQKAQWILHRDVLKAARKLKDSNNNYIWSTGIGPGTGFQGLAPTLLGMPYNESEYAPNTFTTGLYMAIVGDFSFYWIADALDMQIQVLQELYAATNQMGYILRKETDGLPVLGEAFARLKLA